MIDNKREKALKHVKEFFTCELIPCRFPYKSCQRSTEERRKILSQPAYIRKKIYARQEAERERERQVKATIPIFLKTTNSKKALDSHIPQNQKRIMTRSSRSLRFKR